jgi:hypothetical protein
MSFRSGRNPGSDGWDVQVGQIALLGAG